MNPTTPALSDTAPAPAPAPRQETARRITALDALSGFALCGILLVNINQITPINHTRHPAAGHLAADLAVLAAGLLGTVASVTLVGGGMASIPGLFLLGLAVARLGIAHTLDRRTGQLAALFALAARAAAAATWWQHTYPGDGPLATRIPAGAGLLGALTYATALLRTPLGRPLSAVLEPLGRMALTNYITATLAVIAGDRLLGLADTARWGTAMLLAAGILAVQAVFSG